MSHSPKSIFVFSAIAALTSALWFSAAAAQESAGKPAAKPAGAAKAPANKPASPAPAKSNACQLNEKAVKVKLTTSMGAITLELDNEKAPLSTANFVKYVESGHYDGTIFHRVMNGFMIQGGGFDTAMMQKPTNPPIKNEAANGLKNLNYTVAMARTSVIDSATSQFFINVKDNDMLNYRDPLNAGYAVFGKVVQGTEVVDKIKALPTGSGGPFPTDVPATQVVIQKAECL